MSSANSLPLSKYLGGSGKLLKREDLIHLGMSNTKDDETAGKDIRMTSLIIEAIKSAPSEKMAVSNIYKKLVELNPALQARRSDWQGTVRHILSTSTLFVLDPETRPGQWKIDPNGERSTHKNRRRKREEDSFLDSNQVPCCGAKKDKKRLGTTKRFGEGSFIGWPSKFNLSERRDQVIEYSQTAQASVPSTALLPSSDFTTATEDRTIMEAPLITSNEWELTQSRFTETFIGPSAFSFSAFNRPRTLPSQIIDTATEPFPPMPRLDTWHRVHSQSSSITLSQSQSQSQSQ